MQRRGNKNRGGRINEAIKEEMALIFRDIKDPRIDPLTSIVKVDTTRDLKYCKIYYSVLGDEESRQATAEGLKAAAGFIRRELATRVNLRITPELTFIRDDSIEYSIYLGEKFKEIHEQDEIRNQMFGTHEEPEDEIDDLDLDDLGEDEWEEEE